MKAEITRRVKYPVGLAKRVDNREKVCPEREREAYREMVKNVDHVLLLIPKCTRD